MLLLGIVVATIILLLVGFILLRVAVLAWRAKQLTDTVVEVLLQSVAKGKLDKSEAMFIYASEMNKVDWSELVFSFAIRKERFFREEEILPYLKEKG